MSQQLEQQLGFTCASCGKQFRWKPELAGKTVACKCSATIAVPAAAGGVAHAQPAAAVPAPSPAPATIVAPAAASAPANAANGAAAIARASSAPGLAGAARAGEVPPRVPAAAAAAAAPTAKLAPAANGNAPTAPPTPPPIPKKQPPAHPPAASVARIEPAPEADLDSLYALAGEAERAAADAGDNAGYKCSRCGVAMQPGSVICLDCGTDQRTGKKLATKTLSGDDAVLPAAGAAAAAVTPALPWGVRRRPAPAPGARGATDEDIYFEGGKFKSLYLPLILIAVGLGLSMLRAYLEGGKVVGAVLLIVMLASAALSCVLLFLGLLASVKLFDMGFGAVGPALLKVVAIGLGPGAVGGMVSYAVGGGFGGAMLGGLVSMILYWTLISVLFDLDLGEVLTLCGIIYLIENWVKPFILLALFYGAMGGIDVDPFSGDADGDGLDDEARVIDPAAFGTGSGTRAILEGPLADPDDDAEWGEGASGAELDGADAEVPGTAPAPAPDGAPGSAPARETPPAESVGDEE